MQRKSTKQSPAATADDKKFIVWTKEQDCAYCGNAGPSRYDHCAGSSAKIKVDYQTVLIGHRFGLAECMSCAELGHRAKRDAFGSHGKLWARENARYESETGTVTDQIIKGGIELFAARYNR